MYGVYTTHHPPHTPTPTLPHPPSVHVHGGLGHELRGRGRPMRQNKKKLQIFWNFGRLIHYWGEGWQGHSIPGEILFHLNLMFDLAQILRKGQLQGLLLALMQRTKFLAWVILHSGLCPNSFKLGFIWYLQCLI